MKKIISLFTLMLVAAPVAAKYHSVDNERKFEQLINEYPYAVVCFAPSGAMGQEKLETSQKRKVKDEYRSLESKVKSAADSGDFRRYLNKDVGFLVVDVAAKRAREVDQEYALKQFPTCLVFQQGKALNKARIVKPTSKNDLTSLLDNSFGDRFDQLIEDKKEEQRAEREERIARYAAYASYYPYGYWGWGYPYGGWGWGGGWGLGFGGGLGYGGCGRW